MSENLRCAFCGSHKAWNKVDREGLALPHRMDRGCLNCGYNHIYTTGAGEIESLKNNAEYTQISGHQFFRIPARGSISDYEMDRLEKHLNKKDRSFREYLNKKMGS